MFCIWIYLRYLQRGDPIEFRYKEHSERGTVIDQLVYCINSYREAAMSNDSKFDHIELAERQKVFNISFFPLFSDKKSYVPYSSYLSGCIGFEWMCRSRGLVKREEAAAGFITKTCKSNSFDSWCEGESWSCRQVKSFYLRKMLHIQVHYTTWLSNSVIVFWLVGLVSSVGIAGIHFNLTFCCCNVWARLLLDT